MKVVINNYAWYLYDNILYENQDKSGANIDISYLTRQEKTFFKNDNTRNRP